MGLLKLAISRQSKTLVEFNGSRAELPPLYQTNTQDFQIQVVDETGDPSTPYEAVDCSALDLRMVIAAEATGTLGDPSILAEALEASWAWDVGLQAFLGSLNLRTSEIEEHIGEESFKAAILEINLISGGVAETIYGQVNGQSNVNVQANADEGGSAAPSIIEQAETAGVFTIQNGVGGVVVDGTRVSITGLALAGGPSAVYPWVECPADNGFIGCNFEVGSATADGFSVRLSAVPPNNNYKVRYVLTF